ncbi:MAG: hypothetical protein DHS20C18_48650 [Saprospiraceae bacterium]|nr:MAG: hypothetical protein DHS20C18_48650 [Saprospiraceae bacterium]
MTNLIKQLTILTTGLLLLPLSLLAQELNQKQPTGLNNNKIELLIRDIEVTRTNSQGNISSYFTEIPQLRINNGDPVDFKSSVLQPYLQDCPSARRQLELFDQEIKQAKKVKRIGLLAGSGLILGGLFSNIALLSKDKETYVPFALGFGLGIGSILYGGIKSRKHRIVANRYRDNSVKLYNKKCYLPLENGALNLPLVQDSLPPEKKTAGNDGITRHYQDTVLYELIENDPKNYRFASLSLIPLDIEGANYHGFTYRIGLALNYHHSSRFYANASYKIALVDNLTSSSDGGKNKGGNVNPRISPADYQRAQELRVLGSLEFFGKDKEVSEEIYLGTQIIGGLPVQTNTDIQSKRRISWSVRAGVTTYRSVLYSESGLDFSSTEDPRTEVPNPLTGEPFVLHFDQLENGMAMLRSTNLSAGISRRAIRNLKIEVHNKAFKGKKRNSFVSEWYADLLYAPKLELGKVNYEYHYRDPGFEEDYQYEILPDATPLRKLGWRAGFRFYSARGWDLQLEVGQRPGLTKNMEYFSCSAMKTLGVEF